MPEKKMKAQVKLVINAKSATPAPPVGPALGQYGIQLVQFCKEFNDQTASMVGSVPVLVTVYEDRSFTFILKTPAVSELVKQAIGITSGSNDPLKKSVGTITMEQIRMIAEKKLEDLNTADVESAIKQVIGTCRSMGVKVTS